jgi:hypothetical protein
VSYKLYLKCMMNNKKGVKSMRDSGNTRRDTSYPVEDRSPHHPNVHDYRREGTRFQPTAFTQVETEVQRWVRQGWGEDNPQTRERILSGGGFSHLRNQYYQEQEQMRRAAQTSSKTSIPHSHIAFGHPQLAESSLSLNNRSGRPPTSGYLYKRELQGDYRYPQRTDVPFSSSRGQFRSDAEFQANLHDEGESGKRIISKFRQMQDAINKKTNARCQEIFQRAERGAVEEVLQSLFIGRQREFPDLLRSRYISRYQKQFEEIGYNLPRFDAVCWRANSSQDAFDAAGKMFHDLFDFLNVNHDRIGKADVETDREIERGLEALPRGSCPTIVALDKREWWQIFLDKPLHEKAQQLQDPGLFCDVTDHRGRKNRGYKRGMIKLFQTVLASNERKNISYEDYIQMHEIAIKYSDDSHALQVGGISLGHYGYEHNMYPIGEPPIDRTSGADLYERIRAFEEMQNEYINNLPLLKIWRSNDEYVEQIIEKIARDEPQAIRVGWLEHDNRPITQMPKYHGYETKTGNIIMLPAYLKEECREHVIGALSSFYAIRKIPGQTGLERVKEIAKLTRQLVVMQPNDDGNTRVIVCVLMNKLLMEEGFSPSILPVTRRVFCGTKTLRSLAKDIVIGMHNFMTEVEKSRRMLQVQYEPRQRVQTKPRQSLSRVGIFMRPPGKPKEPPEWNAASASCVLA